MTDRDLRQAKQRFPLLHVALGLMLCLFAFLPPLEAFAEDEILFDEVLVFFNVSGLGGKELEAIIKAEQVYLPVSELFEYLKINNQLSDDNETVSGFFLFENNRYVIDKTNNRIVMGDKTYPLDPDDLMQTLTGLYLRSEVFGKVFGLDCVFNFRSLSVNLNTKLDLPVIRERRQEMMRTNLSKLKREIKADTTLSRNYPAFHFGNFDWAVTSTQQQRGTQDTRLNLRLGTIIAGGETNLALNYDTRQDFKLRQQNYLWRYVNNDRTALRQVKAGKIPVQSTASLYAPVLGVQLTNTPTTYRRSFGTYTLSDFTEPEWVVELYINNVLVDYVKSDASGFFTFQVPMIYGNTAINLRFYGPWGEERFKEEKINVPYNFLPKNELEYTFSAGMLEDGKQSRFSRFDLKYGLGSRITVGTGAEYLSALSARQIMPFVNASLRVSSNILLSADYTYGVRGKAILNYRMPADLLLELNYTRYQKGQQAILQNFLEERKVMISRPFRSQKISGFSRLSINQVIYPNIQQTRADLLLSASMKGISANLSTYAQMIHADYLNVYSTLALAFRLPSRLTLRPQVQYGYKFQRINEARVELEKQVFGRGFLNASYQNNFNYNTQSFNLGLRFDLSFARASFSARQTNNRAVFSQSLSGGALVDAETRYFNMNNRSNVGKGGLVIYPFLDLNRNNRRDKDEPKIQGLKLKISGGRIQNNIKDTTLQVFDLEPYNSYLLELNRSSFDNIAWQMKNAAYKVTIEPNKLKLIEVPVMVSGEVSGMIYGTAADSSGQGRIMVNFYREGIFAGRTLTESDGYFNYLGLAPGAYTACIDSAQLSKLKLRGAPASLPFTMAYSLDGDVVSDVNFKLQNTDINTPDIIDPVSLAPLATVNLGNPETGALAMKALLGEKNNKLKEAQPAQIQTLDASGSGNGLPENPVTAGSLKEIKIGNNTQPAAPRISIESLIQPAENSKQDTDEKETPNTAAGKTLNDAGYSIKISAIGNRASAQNLQNNLMQQYDHMARVYFEGTNSYQLTILGFKDRADAETFLPVLAKHGLRNPYILAPRAVFKPAVKETNIRFQILAGRAADQAGIDFARKLIQKTVNRSAFAVKDAKGFRLSISGYPDRNSAEQDYQKLLAAGLDEGHISAYREKLVEVKERVNVEAAKDPTRVRPTISEQALRGNSVPLEGPGSTATKQGNDTGILRFRLVAGQAADKPGLKELQELILKLLNTPSYLINDGQHFRLHISGFKDRIAAEAARQKLIAAGLLPVYITTYRELEVKINDRK